VIGWLVIGGESTRSMAARQREMRARSGLRRRLRVETAVTLKWIAAELHVGHWTQVANWVQNAKGKSKSTNQHELGFE
jgi:hypothetical protein